jgi:hypothetical protein
MSSTSCKRHARVRNDTNRCSRSLLCYSIPLSRFEPQWDWKTSQTQCLCSASRLDRLVRARRQSTATTSNAHRRNTHPSAVFEHFSQKRFVSIPVQATNEHLRCIRRTGRRASSGFLRVVEQEIVGCNPRDFVRHSVVSFYVFVYACVCILQKIDIQTKSNTVFNLCFDPRPSVTVVISQSSSSISTSSSRSSCLPTRCSATACSLAA